MTIHDNINDFGSDWIVNGDTDGHLFQEPSPFPDKCNLPSMDDSEPKRRRLSASSVTRAEALDECTKWVSQDALESCVMDVLISEDLGMAANEEL